MNEDEIDVDHYSKVLKQQARNESDKILELKRKIEDNETIIEELSEEEHQILVKTLQHEIDNLETMAGKSRELLEKKLNEKNT